MGQPSFSPFRRELARQGRPSVVVIEDNPADVFLIQEALRAQKLELELEIIEDGETAIDLIARLDEDDDQPCPRLMLLDINLPRKDGFEVLARLRNSKRCADIPVIVMTSSATQSDRARSAELGANAYFQKPAGYAAFLKIGDVVRSQLK